MQIGMVLWCTIITHWAEPRYMQAVVVDNRQTVCYDKVCYKAMFVQFKNNDFKLVEKEDCLTEKPKRNK